VDIFSPFGHLSKRQGAVERSSTGAEVKAANDVILKLSLPALGLLEDLYQAKIPYRHEIDNDAGRLLLQSGASRQLRYLPKHQGIEFSLFRELFDKERHGNTRRAIRVDTAKNRADLHTKPLGRAKFEELREAGNVLPFADFEGDVYVRTQAELDSLFAAATPKPESKLERGLRECPKRVVQATARAAKAVATMDPEKRKKAMAILRNGLLGAPAATTAAAAAQYLLAEYNNNNNNNSSGDGGSSGSGQ